MNNYAQELQNIVNLIKNKYPDVVATVEGMQPALKVDSEYFKQIITELKAQGLDFLVDLTALEENDSLTCVYHLMSLQHFGMLRIKVELNKENPQIQSLVDLWPAANVQEREVFDLLGVEFIGHPNLKRILCPDEFEGHPLRKDYEIKSRR